MFGLADDAVVMSWIAATVVNETESYLAWERLNLSKHDTAARETVQGDVLR